MRKCLRFLFSHFRQMEHTWEMSVPDGQDADEMLEW